MVMVFLVLNELPRELNQYCFLTVFLYCKLEKDLCESVDSFMSMIFTLLSQFMTLSTGAFVSLRDKCKMSARRHVWWKNTSLAVHN